MAAAYRSGGGGKENVSGGDTAYFTGAMASAHVCYCASMLLPTAATLGVI